MAIYDTMQFVACDVATVCLGFAASMGQFLLTAGAAGKRYSLPNARIMMHQPLAGLRGQASDIAIQAEAFTYTKRRMAELIAQHSGKSVDQIKADFERDRWFTAEQARTTGSATTSSCAAATSTRRSGRYVSAGSVVVGALLALLVVGDEGRHRSDVDGAVRQQPVVDCDRGLVRSRTPGRRRVAPTPDRPARPCSPSRS